MAAGFLTFVSLHNKIHLINVQNVTKQLNLSISAFQSIVWQTGNRTRNMKRTPRCRQSYTQTFFDIFLRLEIPQ